jgi:hypothetical protein
MLEQSIDRWNKYKERLDTAKIPLIRAFLHLVRPTEEFPKHTVAQIRAAYDDWVAEERAFNAATEGMYGSFPRYRVFPETPADGAPEACWRMWGISIQFQVEGDHTTGYNLPGAVEAILATPECASHDASCPCRVSVNPWTYHEHVKALEPLLSAKAKRIEERRAEWLKIEKAKETAHSASCACGPCFWRREKVPTKVETDVDFAKSLFKSVQGVNFDDKCPHGLPFYACMPCSH